MTETSILAHEKIKGNGNLERNEKLILWVLENHGNTPLTAYGIAKKAYYENELGRTYKISHVDVGKRTAKMKRENRIRVVGRLRDADGSIRDAYQIVGNL